jgi:hypothetical protein
MNGDNMLDYFTHICCIINENVRNTLKIYLCPYTHKR